MLLIILLLSLMAVRASAFEDTNTIDLSMPNVQPHIPDLYLCRGIKLGAKETYITGFVPKVNMDRAHHLLVVGCNKPGEYKPTWRCRSGPRAKTGPNCGGGTLRLLYDWSRNAPALYLPKENRRDNSGVQLITQTESVRHEAGIFILGATGSLSPRSTVYMESACRYLEAVDFHPFAYRVHTHELGKVVSGYRIRDGQWDEIGRENPLKAQMFYNTTSQGMVVKAGDILAVRCTMYNSRNYTVPYGLLESQEMCVLYIMYYVDGHQLVRRSNYFSPGPPKWSWKDFPGDDLALQNIPEEVSTVPGTDFSLEKPSTDVSRDFLEQLGIVNFRKYLL